MEAKYYCSLQHCVISFRRMHGLMTKYVKPLEPSCCSAIFHSPPHRCRSWVQTDSNEWRLHTTHRRQSELTCLAVKIAISGSVCSSSFVSYMLSWSDETNDMLSRGFNDHIYDLYRYLSPVGLFVVLVFLRGVVWSRVEFPSSSQEQQLEKWESRCGNIFPGNFIQNQQRLSIFEINSCK